MSENTEQMGSLKTVCLYLVLLLSAIVTGQDAAAIIRTTNVRCVVLGVYQPAANNKGVRPLVA